MIRNETGSDREHRKAWGRMVLSLLFASMGFVAIKIVMAPVRIKLLTSLLSKEDYGLLTLGMLTISFITIISSLGSLEFMLRKVPGQSESVQFGTLRTIVSFFCPLAGVIAVIGVAALTLWLPAAVGLGTADVIALGLVLVLTVHLTQLAYFLMGRSEYARSRLLALLYADAWFLPILVLMKFFAITISFMLWLWVAWLLLSVVASQFMVRARDLFRHPAPPGMLRDVLAFGVPLLPMIMGEWIFQIQDRYVLLAYTNLAALANYTLCFNIAWVGMNTGTSLLDLLVTEFYKVRNLAGVKDIPALMAHPPLRRSFTLMLRYGLVLSIPIVLALWIARRPIILFLSDPKFADAADIMKWLALLPFFYIMTIIAGRALMATDRGRIVGKGTLVAAALQLGLSILLTPKLAERGVALAGCTAYGLLAVYLGIRVRLLSWINWGELQPVRLVVFALITAIGLHGAVRLLAPHSFLALLAGGMICLAAMLLLGLVRKTDIHLLTTAAGSSSEPEDAALQEPFARD